jgi:hypothetical protein
MKNLFFLFLSVSMFWTSCGPATVESETSRWNSNKERISKLGALYPNFKPLLQTILTEAETKMKAAESMSKAEEKIIAMGAANTVASPNFVSILSGISDKIKSLKDAAVSAQQKTTDKNDSNAAWSAASSAENTIRACEMKLQSAQPANVSEANAIAEAAEDELDAAKKRLDDVAKVASGKAADAKKTEEDAKKAAADDKKAEEAKVADVVCSYCKKSSPAGSKECGGCGAALK